MKCLVVLSHLMSEKGVLGAESLARTKLAIDILRQTAEADGIFSHEEKKLWEILKNILKD